MHGGDIYRNSIEHDFSISINPVDILSKCADILELLPKLISCYPDIKCARLKRVIARVHEVKEEKIVCTNGASELINSLCVMNRPKSALICAPSFSGYERALSSIKANIIINYLKEDNNYRLDDDFIRLIDDNKPEIIFITNPNNPDGNLIDIHIKEQIVQSAKNAGSLLVVDECFIELTNAYEQSSFLDMLCNYENIIIIRALTKTYALPGVRLGYGICASKAIADRVEEFLPEWNVSMIAQNIGCRVLGDKEYLLRSREYITKEREYLCNSLNKLGIRVFDSDANYLLFKMKIPDNLKEDNFDNLYDYLLKRGILIRHCSDYKGLSNEYYRIAVKNHEANELLIINIKEYISSL